RARNNWGQIPGRGAFAGWPSVKLGIKCRPPRVIQRGTSSGSAFEDSRRGDEGTGPRQEGARPFSLRRADRFGLGRAMAGKRQRSQEKSRAGLRLYGLAWFAAPKLAQRLGAGPWAEGGLLPPVHVAGCQRA